MLVFEKCALSTVHYISNLMFSHVIDSEASDSLRVTSRNELMIDQTYLLVPRVLCIPVNAACCFHSATCTSQQQSLLFFQQPIPGNIHNITKSKLQHVNHKTKAVYEWVFC